MSREDLEAALQAAYFGLSQRYGTVIAIQAVGKLLASVALVVAPADLPDGVAVVDAPTAAAEEMQQLSSRSFPSSTSGGSNSSSMAAVGNGSKISVALSGAGRVLNAARVAALTGPRRWAAAIQLAVQASDPWSDRQIHMLPMERAVRHRYNPDNSTWVLDDVLVKMEKLPFAAGAMRECFATKKLSTMGGNVFHDWKKAQNCVTKRYKKDTVNRAFYFTDILVQMDAKMLGEEYNRTGPPKKVDFIQPSILEFRQREGSPVMSMEQLIEGPYIKYNSNSGFVLGDDLLRHTPQAFSHFSFNVTNGQKICVDVQGVGDLYTDPQIHTLDGHGYGEGNLGLRGMALFFRAHECNALCSRLNIPQFSRCPTDVAVQGYLSESSSSANQYPSHTAVRLDNKGRNSGTSVRRRLHDQHSATRLAVPTTGLNQLREAAAAAPVEDHALAHVHLETARLYGEIVLLPELRPQEDPVQAVAGGLFHLQLAAVSGCAMAAAVMTRAHLGVQASAAQLAALIKAATLSGQFVLHPEMAFHYTHVVAASGVAQAACALGHAYATGSGVAEGVLQAPDAERAVAWYQKALLLLDVQERETAAASKLGEELDTKVSRESRAPSGDADNNCEAEEHDSATLETQQRMCVDALAHLHHYDRSSSSGCGRTSPHLHNSAASSCAASAMRSDSLPTALTVTFTTYAPANAPVLSSSSIGHISSSSSGVDDALSAGAVTLDLPSSSGSSGGGGSGRGGSACGRLSDVIIAKDSAVEASHMYAVTVLPTDMLLQAADPSVHLMAQATAEQPTSVAQAVGASVLVAAVQAITCKPALAVVAEVVSSKVSEQSSESRAKPLDSALLSGLLVNSSSSASSANSQEEATQGVPQAKSEEPGVQQQASEEEFAPPPFSLFMSPEFRVRYIEMLEEEVGVLPGADLHRYEIQSALAALLLTGGEGVAPNAAAACQLFNDAAEAAMELGKGKLAQKLYEKAAEAESLLESSSE